MKIALISVDDDVPAEVVESRLAAVAAADADVVIRLSYGAPDATLLRGENVEVVTWP